MFTGIVTAVGEIRATKPVEGGIGLTIAAPYRRVALGESIAVSGACLTVIARGPGWFEVQVVRTTLERTRFGEVRPGSRLNLERALKAGDALGGHLVQGHVDGVGAVVATRSTRDSRLVELQVPEQVAAVTLPLGSIAIDGVSLTVNAMESEGIIQVALIPHTLRHTTLGALAVGDQVHLEGDMIGKYVRAYLERWAGKLGP